MSFWQRKYKLKGWNDKTYQLTAKELFERVSKDSESDYNWIAPATEIVRVCNEPDFPKMYEQKIKLIILNCFANLELKKENPSKRKKTDNQAIYSCYHSLIETDENVIRVKKKYLTAIITGIIKYTKDAVRFTNHIGPAYYKVCEDWKKEKLEEYFSKEKIDFEKLREKLYVDFEKTIKKAENDGVFEEDDEKNRKVMLKFLSSINLKESDLYM